MATKAKPQGTAVVKAASNLPASWKEELAKEAKKVAAIETPSVSNISFRSGVMSWQGQPVEGNKMQVIVVGTAYERALYDGPFDPNKVKSPICFALARDGLDMEPHANSLHPQHDQCKGCPMNEWGSAGEGRRGKACKETRRLALIPADSLDSIEDLAGAELAMAKIPVTSVSNWSNYVHKTSAVDGLPFWAVLTEMKVKPHIKNQFEVSFNRDETIDDQDALAAIMKKVEMVDAFVMAPYSIASEEEEKPAPKGPPKPAVKKKF